MQFSLAQALDVPHFVGPVAGGYVLPSFHAGSSHNTAGTRRWLIACVATAAALTTGPRPAPGQDGRALHSSGTPAGGTASIVGVVDDSLHGGPLAGAVILLDGQPREAVTDSIGRFRLDSVAAGRYRMGIFHPILDSLGTSLSTTPVRLIAGRPAVVTLSTPSERTVMRAVCPNGRPATANGPATAAVTDADDSAAAVLVGHVLDPDTDEPVPNARVTLTWTEIRISRTEILNTERRRETMSDGQGEFQFCALPAGVAGTVRARRVAGADSSVMVEREVELGSRIVTLTTLHLPAPRMAASAPQTSAAPATPATPAARPALPLRAAVLAGRVQRPDGRPVPGAIALVEGTGDSAVASDEGMFTIRGLPSGTHMLIVRSVGFEPASIAVELTRREVRQVVVVMMNATYVLSPVVVQAQQLALGYANVGFSQRRRVGVGQYMTLDDITRRHVDQLSDLFTGLHGVRLAYGGPAGTDVVASRGTHGCLVYVIDGQPFNPIVHGEVDAMLVPGSLAGIEVYTPSEVPEQFRVKSLPGVNEFGVPTMGTTGCTTIVIWSKVRLGVKD
jgi:CarboxypepD_reg-like domain/Carboxypeptidase regulatory-like domain